MVPVKIKELEIEVTRNCNGFCAHCMRGAAQDVEPSISMLQNLFAKDHKIVKIDNLMLTGGEVFLNPEGLLFIFNYLISENIYVGKINIVTNCTIYNEDVLNVLDLLRKRGTFVKISYHQDQFHPRVKDEILKKYMGHSYFNFENYNLKKREIYALGKAEENNIGSLKEARRIMKIFSKIKNNLNILNVDNEKLIIESLYLTALGKFGAVPTDASWDMIDSKYNLDIEKDSIFKNCTFSHGFKKNLKYLANYPYLPASLISDYHKAQEEGTLDIFLKSLNDEVLREYFLTSSYTRSLI